jgi:hypothetical protein
MKLLVYAVRVKGIAGINCCFSCVLLLFLSARSPRSNDAILALFPCTTYHVIAENSPSPTVDVLALFTNPMTLGPAALIVCCRRDESSELASEG